MKILAKAEKIIFYFLVFCLPLQIRHIFHFFGQPFNEWQAICFYATDILILALLGLWLARSWQEKNSIIIRSVFSRPGMALTVFLVISGLSVFLAQNKFLGLYSWVRLAEFALLFFYLKINFAKLFSLERFWQIFALSAFCQSIIAIAQFFNQGNLGFSFFHESPLAPGLAGVAKIIVNGQPIVRAYGLVPHPNVLAAILITAIFGLAWLTAAENSRFVIFKKTAYVLFLAVSAAALFFTFSRSVIVVGLIFLAFWLFLVWYRTRAEILTTAITLFAVFCLLLMFFWPYAAARYGVANLAGEQALNLRVFYNQAAAGLMGKHLFVGTGQGNFVTALAQNHADLAFWVWQPVHNVYLLVAAETGIIGLLAFLAFLFLTIKAAWRRKSEFNNSHLLFVIGCLLFFGLFDHFLWDLQQGQLLFWILLGILSAHGSLLRSNCI